MYRSSFALFVALLIHFIFIFIFWLLGTWAPEMQKPKPKENRIKISLKELPKKSKDSGLTKEKVKPSPIAPPMPKGSQLKKIVKPKPVKYEPKKQKPKEPKLNPRPKPTKPKPKVEPKPQPKIESAIPKKPYVELHKEQKSQEEKTSDPFAWMKEDRSSENVDEESNKPKNRSSINQNIKQLYGDEFGKLTPGQQQYILDNQEIMRRITQEILTRVARVNLPHDLNVDRVNVIEFKLHPNGDMTDFRFLKKSGYFVLDNTTKETIEYAYSRYPRPKETILIRYNVFYNLAVH